MKAMANKSRFSMRAAAVLGAILTLSASVQAEEKKFGDEEYSTIEAKGQLVPVGEKNRYKNSYNTWNVWVNPFDYFFGAYNLGASYAFHQNIKVNIEPRFVYASRSLFKEVGGGTTLSATFFFKKMNDGFYLEPGAVIKYSSLSILADAKTDKGFTGGPQLIAGWGWIWDSGFTVNLGFGFGRGWSSMNSNHDISGDGFFGAGNLQFGYSF